MSKTLLTAAAVTTLFSGAVLMAQTAHATDMPTTEKCSGISKAGKNDCKSAAHACAGQSTKSSDANEWISVPKGTCDKIAGGKVVASNDDAMMMKK